MTRPVAVLLSPVVPQPTGSGRALRAWDWLLELSASYELHVWTPGPSPVRAVWPPGVWYWDGGHDVRLPTRWGRRWGWLVPSLGVRYPSVVAHWLAPVKSPPALSAMREALGKREVARLVVFRMYLHGVAAWLRERLPITRADLDLDDWDSATHASIAGAQWRMGHRVEALLAQREALQYQYLERKIPARYDKVWLAAPEDISAVPGAELRPNRVSLPFPYPGARACTDLRLLFVGSLDYPPNQEAALLLADRIAPLLRQRLVKPWSLTIAGARSPAWLSARLLGCDGIELLTDVSDMSGVYASQTVAVLPLLAGGGTKLKTLEALAWGLAVVASPQAVRGLALREGVHYLAASTPAEFAQAVLNLQTQPALWAALAAAGRAWSEAVASGREE